MKDLIIEAISNQYCHLLPSIMGWCISDTNDIIEVESFIIALTELVQDGVVVYSRPVGGRMFGKYDIISKNVRL